jgi:hypothetical protein
MINFAIKTIYRRKNYIHKLIRHLRKDMPLRLIVGSPNYDYLERYRRNSNIEIIGIDPNEWTRLKDYNVKIRSSWNYWRCFVYGILPGPRKGLLILEDDVVPAVGWEERLNETIQQIEAQFGEEYVLALYNGYTELAKPKGRDVFYTQYPAHRYGGAQAMYYPEPIRVAFAEYLQTEGVDMYRIPLDWLLNEYLRLTGIPLFATTPCLFEHIGDVSSAYNPYHRAGYFRKNLLQQTHKKTTSPANANRRKSRRGRIKNRDSQHLSPSRAGSQTGR